MSLELTINTDFLDALEPPSSFPPNEDDLTNQVEEKFLQECQKFISNERLLYKCSKSIEKRLSTTLTNSQHLKDSLTNNQQHYQKVVQQLSRYRKQREQLKQRQAVMSMLCDLIKMEQIRKDLLISGDESSLKQIKKEALFNQDEYLSKLSKLDEIVGASEQLQSFAEQFPLLKDILVELKSIFQAAVKILLSQLMTPTMVELSLNKYSNIFFKEERAQHQIFQEALIKNRIQNMKISLNPMINNLSYASNIPELYQTILQTWTELLKQEVSLFTNCKQFGVIRSANQHLLHQLIPRMEKNIFRIKDLVQVVRIRKSFSKFNISMLNIEQLQYKDDSLLKGVIAKSQAVIESMMTEEAQGLQNSKYNIYTMVSYLPIRQHLNKILQCYENSLENEQLDWEGGFQSLCSSRDPKNYPNNKSLLIFNLNIWYLYLKLLPAGKHSKQGQDILQWCQNTFANINLTETKKKYFDSFEKVLEIGGNFSAFKNTIYAEVQLLGHQQLRKAVSEVIKAGYMETYKQTLAKIGKEPMTNEEVKAYCNSKKINLNKFGKFSQSVCIFSPQELSQLLEYS